jgi:HEPN domain-containing protein
LPSPESLEFAQQFFRKAVEDRDAVGILIASDRAADAVIGFHAQQAVEKFAKAVLVARDIEMPRTHDLRFLLDLAGSEGLEIPEAVAASRWLTPWSVEFRYGDDIEGPFDRAAAIATVRAVEQWAAAILAADRAPSMGRGGLEPPRDGL